LSAIALAKAGACTHHFSNAWTPAIPIDLLFQALEPSNAGRSTFSKPWKPAGIIFSDIDQSDKSQTCAFSGY